MEKKKVQEQMVVGYKEMSKLNSQLSEEMAACDEEELCDYEMKLMGSE